MFKVKVKEDIIKYCEQQLKKYNFGQRGYADGTPEQQLVGIIGQTVVLDLFNLPWIDGSKGFDGGVDLVLNDVSIDVKTMGRTTDVRPYYVNNFIGLQKKYVVDAYIFASFNKKTNELTIVGWLPKTLLEEKADFFSKGSYRTRSNGTKFRTFTDLYEIKNSDLFDVLSIDDLKKEITKYFNKRI
jgi:hypothetical protein